MMDWAVDLATKTFWAVSFILVFPLVGMLYEFTVGCWNLMWKIVKS